MNSRLPWSLLCVTLAAALLLASPSQEGAPAAKSDEWHKLYVEGKPAGFLRITTQPLEGGGLATSLQQKIVLKRGPVAVEMEISSTQEEDARGKLLSFSTEQKLSKNSMKTSGVVRGDSLVITEMTGTSQKRESRIPVPPDAVGYRKSEEMTRSALKKPGDSVEIVVFVPEVLRFGKQKAVLGNEEAVDCLGVRKTLLHTTVTQDIMPGVKIDQWVDKDFNLQKSSTVALGLEIVTHRSTAKEVLSMDLSSPPEVFLSTSIRSNKKIPRGAREVTYRVKSKQDGFPTTESDQLFKATGQELVREEGPRARILRVRREAPKASRERPIPPTAELEECLKPNPYIQSDDKKIVETARKELSGIKDAWESACHLERWVHDNIRTKGLETAFATASEVMETREGDCTEHGVLLAALLRAAGLPSKVAAGLIYHDGAFVGHMWTEVYIGEWVPLDATLGECVVGAEHIALTTTSLETSSILDFFCGMVSFFGNVEIEVLDIRE